MKMDISVIISVFNRKKLLIRALDSVFNQSVKNIEIIIIDDGSTDNVEKLLFPVINKYNNIIYCRQVNQGTPSALNLGIRLSKAEYITFLDSDDEYGKNHLAIRKRFLQKNKKIDLLFSNAKVIGTEQDYWVPDARNKNKLIHLNDCIIGSTFFGRRVVFEKLNGFRDKYAHDYDFFKRAVNNYNVLKIDSPTYIYHRETKNSVINNLKSEMSG